MIDWITKGQIIFWVGFNFGVLTMGLIRYLELCFENV